MADILKLKKKAADFEAKKQMDKALATYREMIEVYERGDEDPIDIPLYNRVGDLLQKAGNLPEAVSVWERAVDHYAEGGFYNPAIALCNKILRQSPGRAVVYYKLGKISAEKGFKGDARQNFLEYASRMQKAGNLDEAFRALKEFADLVPDQDDVRLMLADQLVKAERKDEAIEQLQVAYAQCLREGRSADADAVAARIKAIDPSIEPRADGGTASSKGGGLVFLDLDPSPAVAVSTRRTGSVPSGDIKRLTKAVAGLDLLDTGIEPASAPAPAARIATPVPAPAPAARPQTPERPAAAVEATAPIVEPPSLGGLLLDQSLPVDLASAPKVPAGDLAIEPTSVGGDAVIEPPTLGGSLLIEPTSVSDVPPPPRDSVVGLEATAVETPSLDGLPIMEMPSASLIEEPPIIEAPSAEVTTVEPPAVTEPPIAAVAPTSAPAEEPPAEPAVAPPVVETRATAEAAAMEPAVAEPAAEESAAEESAAEAPASTEPAATAAPVEEALPPIEEAPSVSLKVDLPMLDTSGPAIEVPPEAGRVSTGVGDFSSFGTAPEGGTTFGEGFDTLEVETSEGVHALPLDESFVDEMPPMIEAAPESPLPAAPPEEAPPLPRATSMVLANSVELLREQAIAAPEDWGLRRQLAEALLDDGQREEGVQELEASLAGFERDGDLDTAASVAEEIVRLAPTVIRYHQKRVEFAFRANDRRRLAEAYVELADALVKDGQAAKARVVYQRVLEIEPDDLRAQAALETIVDAPVPEPTPAPRRSSTMLGKKQPQTPVPAAEKAKKSADDDFISLGDWLRDEEAPKSTRMVVEEKEPTGDEQADFADMLRKFKQGVSDNVDEEDHEAHYDLGVAYKEMGLLDEAISEFQKALRGPNNRVRAIEALGQCFVEKQQLPVAATILQRALAEPGVRDEALIGVLYLLGTISEELHLFPDAKRYYERVFAVDIQFRDIGDRLNAVETQIK